MARSREFDVAKADLARATCWFYGYGDFKDGEAGPTRQSSTCVTRGAIATPRHARACSCSSGHRRPNCVIPRGDRRIPSESRPRNVAFVVPEDARRFAQLDLNIDLFPVRLPPPRRVDFARRTHAAIARFKQTRPSPFIVRRADSTASLTRSSHRKSRRSATIDALKDCPSVKPSTTAGLALLRSVQAGRRGPLQHLQGFQPGQVRWVPTRFRQPSGACNGVVHEENDRDPQISRRSSRPTTSRQRAKLGRSQPAQAQRFEEEIKRAVTSGDRWSGSSDGASVITGIPTLRETGSSR